MSKISKAANKSTEIKKLRLNETVKNFMNGDSYTVNPLDTLKMVSASSIFGEPSEVCPVAVSSALRKFVINSELMPRNMSRIGMN